MLAQSVGEKRVWWSVTAAVVGLHGLLIVAFCWFNTQAPDRAVPLKLQVQMGTQGLNAKDARPPVKPRVMASVKPTPAAAKVSPAVDRKHDEAEKIATPPLPTQPTVSKSKTPPKVSTPPVTKPPTPAAAQPAVKSKVAKEASAPSVAPSAVKTVQAAPQKAAETAQRAAKQELLKKAERSLKEATQSVQAENRPAVINHEVSVLSEDWALPSAVGGLHAATASYEERLAVYLRQALVLPEHGAVTLAMTLNGEGEILDFKIAQATSPRNRIYIETQLPHLRLPVSFSYREASPYTLQLTLTSAGAS